MLRRPSILTVALLFVSLGLPLSASGKVIILDYHTFLGSKRSSLDYSLQELGAQLDHITSLGYHFVSLEDAIAGRIEGDDNVAITIDDGNRSDFEAYEHVFASRGIKPELFVYPFIVGRSPHALTPEQLKSLSEAGCAVGAHGFFHEYMSESAYRKDPRKVMMEVTRPAPALERITGLRPTLFAYPFGNGCPEVEDALRDAGYQWAFSAGDKPKVVDFSDPALDHFNVPRVIVYHWNREQIFSFLAKRLSP